MFKKYYPHPGRDCGNNMHSTWIKSLPKGHAVWACCICALFAISNEPFAHFLRFQLHTMNLWLVQVTLPVQESQWRFPWWYLKMLCKVISLNVQYTMIMHWTLYSLSGSCCCLESQWTFEWDEPTTGNIDFEVARHTVLKKA